MKRSDRLWMATLTGLLGVGWLGVAPAAHAQPGGVVRCESIDGRFNRCEVPWRDARLLRQESRGACIRGQSWGMDERGLWVDRGCRGQFGEAREDDRRGWGSRDGDDDRRDDDRYRRDDRDRDGGWRPGPDWDREIRMGCDSNGKRYAFCQVDVGARGGVRLVQQQSDSRCTEGYSWGWNRAGIWTSHGCRGEFAVSRRW